MNPKPSQSCQEQWAEGQLSGAIYVGIQHRGAVDEIDVRLGLRDNGSSCSWRREVFPGGQLRGRPMGAQPWAGGQRSRKH